ncbi:hypothetical protein EDC01DRAFT_616809 [Geopyxis carbonaria]|nr:hypothetical protein EDC01DRAFT_616809 [Geopyxis carbonaria]
MSASELKKYLQQQLRNAPKEHGYRYSKEAQISLLDNLFHALAGHEPKYYKLFFPNGLPQGNTRNAWKLSMAQGAVDGAEYSLAARGKPCGHIFKSGEATYRCKTCSLDHTCVLCSKCFESSDHDGHAVYMHISPGCSGCCDCGDGEAWRIPVKCAIHTAVQASHSSPMDTDTDTSILPPDLVNGIQNTIATALDYICDVISCSPEQLRLPKSTKSIQKDEQESRLVSESYGVETQSENTEYALVLWNDEKHTMIDVQEQVARACKQSRDFGKLKAEETQLVGRSIIKNSTDINNLLLVSRTIEQIKITVTIRSSRDTFREQMCGTIIEWLEDISGCSVGGDHEILRRTICEELLGTWQVGSKASNTEIGKNGIDDHASSEEKMSARISRGLVLPFQILHDADPVEDDMEVDIATNNPEHQDDEANNANIDEDDVDMVGSGNGNSENGDEYGDQNLTSQLNTDVYTTPPSTTSHDIGRVQSSIPETLDESDENPPQIPKTPHVPPGLKSGSTPIHWLESPRDYTSHSTLPAYEDIRQRVRLDWLIMFDLRLWKKARINLRDLYISTVVAIPQFKRILGLRFAGLYTTLSQLYLIADREPDHSIINLSLQILTTPSITAEVVKKGNFLTNLMAILYTFLTTRQVAHPHQVKREGTLAFDGGPVTNPLTNRRMYHFYHDMKYLLGSEYVQQRIREESRYTLQFLDLARLHQGICPNVRAVSEHVEYEAEAWISAALITREINKLSRQFAEAFSWRGTSHDQSLHETIKYAARYATISSMGWDIYRSQQVETRVPVQFKQSGGFQFDTDRWGQPYYYQVVRFSVDKDHVSFHHALHYTLSWLIEAGKNMTNEQLRRIIFMDWNQIKHEAPRSSMEYEPEDLALAMFDMPLRVCVWLAQMKTGMWVRNGFSLRHQMQTYRSVSQRDLTHNRDLFLLQTALVTINPSRMLVNMIDRFNLGQWMDGNYHPPDGYDEAQVLDLAEDFLHLFIVILSDRLPLIPIHEEPNLQVLKIRRELIHILCFKPMQFSDLTRPLPERLQDHESFQEVLTSLTNYRPPDGLSDYGTFELKEEFLDEVDPYAMQFTKNQREEIEVNYRTRMAKKTGQRESEIVFVPQVRPIKTGIYSDLAAFTRTPVFAQIIYYSLSYALQFRSYTPSIPEMRIETFLQLCLHLCHLAILEDNSIEGSENNHSFILHALEKQAIGGPSSLNTSPVEIGGDGNGHRTIVTVLYRLTSKEDFQACWSKINHIMHSMKQKKPYMFETMAATTTEIRERFDVEENEIRDAQLEKKKLLAKERQAKIMAQIKQQQQTFMDSTGFDFGEEDFSDAESEQTLPIEERKLCKYPMGTCILCQEEMNESRVYGTLALVIESNILRQTDPSNTDYLYEVVKTPESLDRSAAEIRPFGVASMNRQSLKRLSADGSEVTVERQGLGKGFPQNHVILGPVAVGCSHLMHYSCFEHYYESARRRHPHQIARNHPENIEKKEFVCPLCKALGNAFFPIIWKPKEEKSSIIPSKDGFERWLSQLKYMNRNSDKHINSNIGQIEKIQDYFFEYSRTHIVAPISTQLQLQLSTRQSDREFPTDADPTSVSGNIPLSSTHSDTFPQTLPRSHTQLEELYKAYQRLGDTYRDNGIRSAYQDCSLPGASIPQCSTLADTLGFSISATEIAQRGIESESGSTLLDKISPQTLTQLRILSETTSSYFAINSLYSTRQELHTRTLLQFKDAQEKQLHQLLVGYQEPGSGFVHVNDSCHTQPLLTEDIFIFLTNLSTCLVPSLGLDIADIMQLCYIAEIVKTIVFLDTNCDLAKIVRKWEAEDKIGCIEGSIGYTEHQLNLFQRFRHFIAHSLDSGDAIELPSFTMAVFRHLIGAYITPFLRKCIILLHTRYGVMFPAGRFNQANVPEQDRLCKSLQLPSVDDIFEAIFAGNAMGDSLAQIISGWCKELAATNKTTTMPHPAIFELVGLPKNFDVLLEEAMKGSCPTTGNEITDPTLCLFCGELFCSQGLCCLEKTGHGGHIGGANKHLIKCGHNIGIFINIRKCGLLYLHNHNGSWAETPYMDAHGETDLGLRRNRQLFLNQRRYDALVRNVWLHHGLPSVISRKLEADMNTGGWDTM